MKTIDRYRIDSVEVIGHTDGQPSPGRSNLDLLLPKASRTPSLSGYQPGSNADLGLLRALAVANHLRLRLDPSGQRGLVIRSYSASSLIASDGRYSPADGRDHAERALGPRGVQLVSQPFVGIRTHLVYLPGEQKCCGPVTIRLWCAGASSTALTWTRR